MTLRWHLLGHFFRALGTLCFFAGLMGCHSSLIFLTADGGTADSGSSDSSVDSQTDGQRPRFGPLSVGPQIEVSSHHAATTFTRVTNDSAELGLLGQVVQLRAVSAERIGETRLIAWSESSVEGGLSLRAVRVTGTGQSPTDVLGHAWTLDGSVDIDANPEVIALADRFVVLWFDGSSQRVLSQAIPREGPFDPGAVPIQTHIGGLGFARSVRRSNAVAIGDMFFVVLGEQGTDYLRFFGEQTNSRTLSPSQLGTYRIRSLGPEQLLLIQGTSIEQYDTRNELVPFRPSRTWENPESDAPGYMPRFLDAVPLGQGRWLLATQNTEAAAQDGIEVNLHLAMETAGELRYLDSMTAEFRVEAPFIGATLSVDGNRFELGRCLDQSCLHTHSVPIEVGRVAGDTLERPQSRCATGQTCTLGQGEEDDLNRASLGAEQVRPHCVPSTVLRNAEQCLIEVADASGEPLFRVGPEADQVEPLLISSGGRSWVSFRQAGQSRLARLGPSPEDGTPFGEDTDFPLGAGILDGYPAIVTRNHQMNTFAVFRPELNQVSRLEGPFVSICDGLIFEARTRSSFLDIRIPSTGQQTETRVRSLDHVSLPILPRIVPTPTGCELLAHDADGMFVQNAVTSSGTLTLGPRHNVYFDLTNFLFPVTSGRGFLVRGRFQDGFQEVVSVETGGSVQVLRVADFETGTERVLRRSSTLINPLGDLVNQQIIASDGESALIVRRNAANVQAVRIDLNGTELYRGVPFQLTATPEVEGRVATVGWTAALGISPGTFLVVYQQYAPALSAYRLYYREVNFLDEPQVN